jgi:cell wall-associated NlpC family hydrolase
MVNIRDEIVRKARSYIGVPFRHRGRCHRGLDCAGLLYVVFSEFLDSQLQDFTDYPCAITSLFVFRTIKNYADRIDGDNAKPGDICLLHFFGYSTHFAILTDSGTMIYTSMYLNRVLEVQVKSCRVVAYYKMKGID